MTESATSASERKQSWELLTFLFALANFLEVAVVAHFVLFTPAFLASIDFTSAEINAWTGPIASAAFLSGIWFVPFWGVLADRYGRKPLILRSYYIEVLAMAIAAVSHNVWMYLIGRALSGFALGNSGLMYAALTEVAPRQRVAFALSVANGSAPLGSLAGALAGGYIVSVYGVNVLFGIDAMVAAAIAVVLTVFYHETFIAKPTPPVGEMLKNAIRAVVRTPVAATLFLISFIYNTAFFFSYSYLPVRIGEIVGERAAPAAIGITQGAAGATTLIGSALFGSIADRAGHRRLLAILMFVAALAWLPLYLVGDIVGITVVWALFNAVSPAVSSLMFTIISLNIPAEKRGAVLSMIYLPMNIAFVVAPISAAVVATNLQVRDVFIGSAILSFVALTVLAVTWNRTGPREGESA